MKMKNSACQTKTSEEHLTNRLKKHAGKYLLCLEDKIAEIYKPSQGKCKL